MACRPRGAVLRPLGNTVVINPPLSLTADEVTTLCTILSESIAEVVGT